MAWDKWEKGAAELLSDPVDVEPKLVIPLLPATRSKQVWRFHRDGTPYKVRLCLDLKAARVNDSVADWKFRYRGLEDIAEKLRKGDWLAAVDISRFYLRLPAGRRLRGAQWIQDPRSYGRSSRLNKRYKHKRWRQLQAVGFGLKTAPAWASVVSGELTRILEAAGVRVVGCFLDDLLIAGSSREECQAALDKAIRIMLKLGIPANEKTILPRSPREGIVFLGVMIRTEDMRFTVSREHREYARDRLAAVLRDGKATKGDLTSIAGVLTWISFVFMPGRPRRQHIYDASQLGKSGSKTDVVQVQGPLQRQLQWWYNTLNAADFVGTRVWDGSATPETVLMHTDASGEDGWGACVMNMHIAGPWPEELRDASMLFKELVPVTIATSLLAKKLPETVFGMAVDNTGAAFTVNKLSCRDRPSSRLMQQLSSDLDAGGHTALATHVRRHRNEHADELSHALFPAQWRRIVKHQQSRKTRGHEQDWSFPFVCQCLRTGECYTAAFRMRRSLFASAMSRATSTDRR